MLKYSVAISALLLSSPMVFAQGAGKDGGVGMSNPGPGSTASESAGAKAGGTSHERSGASSGASEGASGSASDVAPGAVKGSGSAKSESPGHMKSGDSARDVAPGHRKDAGDKAERRSDSRSTKENRDRDGNRADRGDSRSDREAAKDGDMKEKSATKTRDSNEARSHDRNGSSSGASEGAEGRSGSGHRGSITSVTTEQKTRVRSVFTRHHVEPARNLNVAVSVGVRIPHSVHLHAVPVDIIEIVPEYRDYRYILLEDNRVAIVDPDTFEIVDIIVLA